MADAGSFNADLGVNLQFNVDGAGLVEMSRTIKEISKGKDLQRYWKDVETATDNARKAIERYSRNVNSQGLAESFLKQINALKAITQKENLSELFPNMDINFDELIESAKKVAPRISSEFSVSNFEQAFKTFDLLRDKGIELGEVFSRLADYVNVVKRNSELDRENSEFRNLLGDTDIEKLKKDLGELQKLRLQAEREFESFLNINKIERKDFWGDEKFSEYFTEIRNGSMTATDAIARFKTEYGYLLEESFKTNGDTFGIEQLQAFSNKLDSIFRQVEETSTKINDIISNGVITKSVENLSMDSSLSDSQRSLFGNLLKDEESIKSITALFQKLIEESNKTKNSELFNSEQLQQVLSIFDRIENSLSSLRNVISDVGDGEEFSPLLKALNDIKEAASNIKLNFNMDLGDEVSERLNQKVSQASARQLEAYRKLFSAMKGTGKTNKEMLKFFEPDEASVTELIGMYQGIIKRAEEKFKVGNSNVYKKILGSEYDALKREITNANKQLSRADSKRSENGILGDLFGNTKDLSGVIEQLNKIIEKLDEISKSALEFKSIFKEGFNVTASVEEIDKLTNRVKELEDELSKVKLNPVSVDKSNISSGTQIEDVIHGDKIDQVTTSAKELDKTLEQVDIPTDSFDDVLSKLDLTESKLKEIVKITKQSVSDSEGKFHDSYTLKDKRGSTEIYGLSSNTEKGQLLRSNIVEYDAKSAEQEVKAVKEVWDKNVKAIQDYMDAVTKLNNLNAKDKGTGKYSSQIALQEKNVEELKEKALEARTAITSMINPHDVPLNTWRDYLDVMEKFRQASLGSAESVAKLEDALRQMDFSSLESAGTKFESQFKNLSIKPDGDHQFLSWTNDLKELNAKIDEYNSKVKYLKENNIVDGEQVEEVKKLRNEIEETINVMTKTPQAKRGWTDIGASKAAEKVANVLKQNTKMSKEARDAIRAYYDELRSGNPSQPIDEILVKVNQLVQKERELGRVGKSFGEIFKEKVIYGGAAQLAMYYLSFYDFIRYARNAINAVKELDTALIDLKKTTTMSSSELERFYYDSNEVAKKMGVTTQSIIEQASAWSRLGYSTKEASTQMAELSSQFASISPGMSTDDAQEGLVSIMKAWDIDPDQVEREVLDNINILGNRFAETNQDIVEGMKRSAATMAALGQTWTDSFAIFTGAQEVIQNAETVGTALKTLSLRIRGYSEDTEELDSELANITGEVIDLTKTTSNSQGISLFTDASQEHYKSMVDYLGEISDIWDEIDEKSRTQLLEKLFGKRGASVGSAIIGNFDAVRDALKEMEGAAGAADAEMGIIQESIEFKLNALKETWVGTAQAIVDRGDLGTAIDGLTKLSEAIGWVIDKAGMSGTIGIGAGIFAGIKNIGRPKKFGLVLNMPIIICVL